MNAKIIIATHKLYDMPKDEIYLPVHVGREGKEALPYQPDNTGDNISDENINRIWNRFYKIDEARNRNDGGTGIGLSVVKAIMNNYGNSYGVINKEDGVEFYFDLNLKID